MGRRIRFLPGVDRSEIDAKPVGLQRHGSHHFDRYLFVVYLFHDTTGGLKAIARLWALLTFGDSFDAPPRDPFGSCEPCRIRDCNPRYNDAHPAGIERSSTR